MGKIVDEEISKETNKMDLTPMIDCTFLMIIFFMCVTEMVKQELENLTLPQAMSAVKDSDANSNRVIINITFLVDGKTGEVTTNTIIMRKKYNTQDQLETYLKSQAELAGVTEEDATLSKLRVKIRADYRCEYQKVQHAMVSCMKSGITRVSFGSEPKQTLN